MRTSMWLLATLLSFKTFGADTAGTIEKPVVADTPEAFAAQEAWVENEMQTGGRYEFIAPAEKQRARDLLARMNRLLQKSGSVAAMDHSNRLALFNTQEEVNGLLKHNDANRLVCESRAPVGTHIPVTRCHTYRQIEETARNTRVGMRQYDLSGLCNGPAGENPCAPGSHQKAVAGH